MEGRIERGKIGYGGQLTNNNKMDVKKSDNSNSAQIKNIKIFQGISMENFCRSLKIHRWQFSEFHVKLTTPE